MIEPLPNPAYLPRLLKLISSAGKEIILVHYLVELKEGGHDPVRKIARALIAAKRRGVRIDIVLEGAKFEGNYPFYGLMKEAGIACWMDTSETFIHQKVCLVDRRYLITGSQNLTRASLGSNREFAVLTDDRKVMGSFIEEYGEITRQRESIKREVCREGMSLPLSFLKSVAAPLFRVHGALLFDLYLMLYAEDAGKGRQIKIDEEGWGRRLGFDPSTAGRMVTPEYKRYYFKQRMNRVLYRLQKGFGLIDIDRMNDTVMRRPLPESKEEIMVPRSYWSFGWDGRLSFAAKYFYLISLAETMESPFHPWWRKSLESLARQYGCSRPNINAGARELANFGIVERLMSVPKERGGRYTEEPCYYRNDPFYDMDELKRRVDGLRRRYSEAAVETAGKIARLFLKQYDAEVLDALCGLIAKYGKKRTAAAARKMAAVDTSSSRRRLEYFTELMEETR